MSSSSFTPNTSCGPCLYCGKTSPQSEPHQLLSCCTCRRPLHISCLRNSCPQTSLSGDNFFLATCSSCTADGRDCVRRPAFTTLQVLLLLLYNLHLTQEHNSKSGYFHYKVHISNLFNKHWKELASADAHPKRKRVIQSALSGQLAHYGRYFQNGQAELGEGGWYRLIDVVPPAVAIRNEMQCDRRGDAAPSQTENASTKTLPAFQKSVFSIKEEQGGDGGGGVVVEEEDEVEQDDMMGGSLFHPLSEYLKKEEMAFKEEICLEDYQIEEEGEMLFVEDDAAAGEEMRGDEDDFGMLQMEMQPSLFPPNPSSPHHQPPMLYLRDETKRKISDGIVRYLSCYEEKTLLLQLERTASAGPLPPHLYRLRRKLIVRDQKLEHGLPVFNLDEETDHWRRFGHIRTKRQRMEKKQAINTSSITSSSSSSRILDRFQVGRLYEGVTEERSVSFAARLGTSPDGDDDDDDGTPPPPPPIRSPYTLRVLKPYIRRDSECTPPKLQLLREVVSHYHHHHHDPGWTAGPSSPIDYCYVTPKHIPPMNQLARTFFWPGIDLSEVLQYPDHTCVVMYRRLVVGFGVLVPDSGYNEAYLSFLLVHPEWRRAGIATFILYHLIQTCPGKDVTLHVSATNPALLLYQQFGFKGEEFLSNFYDKYLPYDSRECKHAMLMRLRR